MHGDAQDVPQAGEDSVHHLRLSVGPKLGGDDGPTDVCEEKPLCLGAWPLGPLHERDLLTFLSRHLQRLAVAEGAPPPPRCEHLVFQTAVDDTKLHLEEDGDSEANASVAQVRLTCLWTEKPMETATNGNLEKRVRRVRRMLVTMVTYPALLPPTHGRSWWFHRWDR